MSESCEGETNGHSFHHFDPSVASDSDPQQDQTSIVEDELRDAESRLFFIFPELRASFQQQHPSSAPSDTIMERQTGVLWKRRDVFKNRWRPRWFCLNPGQGVLTYYLLTSPPPPSPPPLPRSPDPADATTPPRGSSDAARNRATSWDSQVSNVSENTLDYDVVPRGTIFLLGCSCEVDEKLSRSHEKLYAFTIRPPNSSESNIYLAARTPEMRALWVEKINRVCRVGASSPRATTNGTSPRAQLPRSIPFQTPPQRRLRTQHSIPEEASEDLANLSEIEESSEAAENDDDSQTCCWKSLGASETLYGNVPEQLALQIQEKLKTHLPLCAKDDDNNNSDEGWKQLFHHKKNGHAAYQRVDEKGRSMVKSVAILQHPPQQVFDLLVDISRRQDFETNVRSDDRLRTLNPYTFLDYYAYNAVSVFLFPSHYCSYGYVPFLTNS